MKGTERRRQLLQWLAQAKTLTLGEIVERFRVSKMTAHRDLENLEQRKALKRIHGGAVALETRNGSGAGLTVTPVTQGNCLVCFRPGNPNLFFTITLQNGQQKTACCPHCGVSACLVLGEQVAIALTSDYLSGRSHPVIESFFVLGSTAAPCCQPSMLTFANEEMARRFQVGFGGSLGGYLEAISFLQNSMSQHHQVEGCPHCAGLSPRSGE